MYNSYDYSNMLRAVIHEVESMQEQRNGNPRKNEKKMLEIKIAMEKRHVCDGVISRMAMAEAKIAEFEDITRATSKTENQI